VGAIRSSILDLAESLPSRPAFGLIAVIAEELLDEELYYLARSARVKDLEDPSQKFNYAFNVK
jgi:hypothetical protein